MKQREFNPAAFHLFNWKKKRDVHFTDRFFFSFHSICWTNHLHSCAKHGRTDGSEFILTTDLQTDTYFEEKTVNGKISFFFFLRFLICTILPFSPIPEFFAKCGGFLWGCTDPDPEQHHRRCNKTLEEKEILHLHAHIHMLCVTILGTWEVLVRIFYLNQNPKSILWADVVS